MKNRAKGMTLLELMTAVSVLGVLVAIAVPSFREMTSNSRVTAATNDFVTALITARSEALRRGSITRICASADQATCSGSNDWATGWVVFTDLDNDSAVDAGELVQTWPTLGAGMTLAANSPVLAYSPNGMGLLPIGLLPAGSFQLDVTPPHCSGNRVGRTVVSIVGSPVSSKQACP